jgi:hypothetical protein
MRRVAILQPMSIITPLSRRVSEPDHNSGAETVASAITRRHHGVHRRAMIIQVHLSDHGADSQDDFPIEKPLACRRPLIIRQSHIFFPRSANGEAARPA